MNYLDLNDFNEAIFHIADTIESYQNSFIGKTFVLFFPESSIRTRLSFEKGIKDLGGQCVLFPPATLDKREDLKDVIGYIENWADAVIVRHKSMDVVKTLAEHSRIPIINAMTRDNHPCEITADIYAIKKKLGHIPKRMAFVGEHGNISSSWYLGAKVFDYHLNHVCLENERISNDDDHYTFTTSLEEGLKGAEVVLTDPLSSELRNEDYINKYQITSERMKLTDDAILNPCPPFFRGEEVSAEVIDSSCFVGYEFKKDLLAVQQGIILYCLGER